MSAEQNKAAYQRIVEVWSGGRVGDLDALVAPDVARYYRGHTDVTDRGLEAYKARIEYARTIYADIAVTIEDIAAEGDVVIARLEQRGTHVGQAEGYSEPDYKRWGVQYCIVTRWEAGKLVEERWFWGEWARVEESE